MDSKEIIFDTSVLVALFDSRDTCHNDAKKLKKEFDTINALPDFILQETATVLKLKKDIIVAIYFTNLFLNNKDIKIISMLEYQNVFSEEFVQPENKDLSYIDASLLALHKTGKFKVITFDKHLKKLIDKVKK